MSDKKIHPQYNDSAPLIQAPSYFSLIQKVGSSGVYQRNIFIIFFLNWFVTSLLLMGTSFLFLNPKIDCSGTQISPEKCQQQVCKLPADQRIYFYEKLDIKSLATQFGPFDCENVWQLNALRMTLYIGAFVGYIGIPFISDNYGRKLSIVIAAILTLAGIVILSVSVNIYMACLGLFISGIGCQSTLRINMAVFGEIVQYNLRQRYSIALQIAFGLGQIIIGFAYYFIGDWRDITLSICLISAIIQLPLLAFYLEETPKFAIKKSIDYAIKSLNRIGKINTGKDNIISEQDINAVLQNEIADNAFRTPLDLCRYPSQRSNFIAISVIFFSFSYLYFGPGIIISQLQLSLYISQVVFGVSQAVAYPICLLFIERSPRKKTGYIFTGISALLFVVLIFVKAPKDCDGCTEGIFQLVLVFIARFCICYYFSIFFLFITQIFPLPLRGIGFGTCSAIGAIASSSSQFVLTGFQQINFNPMIMFASFSIISIIGFWFLPQTFQKPLQTNIPEQAQSNREFKISKSSAIYSDRKTIQNNK